METLRLPATPLVPQLKRKFWRRQFAREVTDRQIVFDVILGAIGPVLCFIFDPIAFRGLLMAPLLPDYQAFAYLFSGVQIFLLLVWLILRPVNPIGSRMIGGALLAGAAFCVSVGVVLLPFSVLGLMLGIGIFGFTPFLTALVYLRNSLRAFRFGPARALAENASLASAGLLIAIALPVLASVAIHQTAIAAVNDILQGDPRRADLAAHRLIPFRFFAQAELNKIVDAYLTEKDEARRTQLKSIYLQITGEDIAARARFLDD